MTGIEPKLRARLRESIDGNRSAKRTTISCVRNRAVGRLARLVRQRPIYFLPVVTNDWQLSMLSLGYQ